VVDRVDVSQYRLATHLTIAAFIFAAITWVSRGLAPHTGDRWPRSSSARGAGWLVALVLLQIYLGAFVAGLNAGMTFNTWPLMDGQIVPSGLFAGSPAWLNLFENVMTVQFNHRVMAYVILLVAAVHMARCLLGDVSTTHARRSVVLFALIVLQAIIGIVTLVLVVPLSWALLHQAMAFVVLAFAVAHWRGFYGQYPVEAHA
jgi:heme a synthase